MKLFKKISCIVMVLICTLGLNSREILCASNLDGIPVYLEKKHAIYAETSTDSDIIGYIDESTVIDAIRVDNKFITLNYGYSQGFIINDDDVIYGKDLDKFVKNHRNLFSRKAVTLNDDTRLYSIDDSGVIALAAKDEQFIITDELDSFYKVSFDNSEAYVYKNDVEVSFFVQVADYRKIKFDNSDTERAQICRYAISFVGNPYVWGGTSLTNGADCSGFVQSIFEDYGVNIPRCSIDQSSAGVSIELSQVKPGDLVFYMRGSRIGHVAMYIGDGKIVHAKNSKCGIVVSDMYYQQPVCARDFIS